MSYVRDNGLARARKRRERRSIAILVFCALLVLGAIVFAATFISSPSKQNGPCPNGTVSSAPPEIESFTLNVYNASGSKGAAGTAAEALRTHGFSMGVVGNDPYQHSEDGVGEVRFGPDGAALAKRYVATLVPGAKLVQDGRDGNSVDVVVGSSFPTIAAAPASPSPSPVCK